MSSLKDFNHKVPFNYFERFIAFRYLVPLRKGGLLSVISWLSFIGICIGVATLIIVMSVMNGFHIELKDRIIGFNGHIFIQKSDKYFEYQEELSNVPSIKFIDPNITLQALISSDDRTTGIVLKSFVKENIKHYSFSKSIANNEKINVKNSIILGSDLALALNVIPGEDVKVLSSNMLSTPFGQIPKSQSMVVAGIFTSGMSEYDSNFAYTSLSNIQSLIGIKNLVSTIEVHLNDISELQIVKKEISEVFGNSYIIRDWIELNSSFWEVLATERELMFFVLSLIIIIAAFNVITSLFILVQTKSKEIAVLKTIGTSDISVLRIFLIVGSFIGTSGTILGTILGILFTINIDSVRNFLNNVFDLNLFPSEFYYLDKMPTNIDINQIAIIFLFSLSVSIVATIYPAYKASKTEIKGILGNG
tara:strand:- start:2236 stop:3492 length:1257 start_codon:yes stop_codon:yes gene_type:complete